ncbi:OLC1v1014189C1 [Oldenlandia corymbosa var. corymbosa]|uniref:OLC1v1014189C1 n=1 Tax=Oldenlandia corymbosa var. corymbosa TaxID=529605 RepID=A0AAV1E3J4_OLDCO|nr:OLC1v1014189C1 [Oldenlandia corymbosa var. corymbosa]
MADGTRSIKHMEDQIRKQDEQIRKNEAVVAELSTRLNSHLDGKLTEFKSVMEAQNVANKSHMDRMENLIATLAQSTISQPIQAKDKAPMRFGDIPPGGIPASFTSAIPIPLTPASSSRSFLDTDFANNTRERGFRLRGESLPSNSRPCKELRMMSLPPQWPVDHRIVLRVGSYPFKIAPYLCPHAFNNEIQQQVNEMMSRKPHSRPTAAILSFCKAFNEKNRGLSVYEKELITLILVVSKWRHYLAGVHFIIRTDHQSLKYLLEQKITNNMKHKWLTKLMGYDYVIQYKMGKENNAADALSRTEREVTDKSDQATYYFFSIDPDDKSEFQYVQGLLRKKGRLYVGAEPDIRMSLMEAFHSSPLGGHSGQNKMDTILGSNLYELLLAEITDGQTERVNQCVEAYLRYFCSEKPATWSQWIPLAEWCYSSSSRNDTATGLGPQTLAEQFKHHGNKPARLTVSNYFLNYCYFAIFREMVEISIKITSINPADFRRKLTPKLKIKCLTSPLKPQYGGGIVVNPEFNEEGLKGWSNFGEAKLTKRVDPKDANNFVVAYARNKSYDSLKQTLTLHEGNFYVISAWVRVSHGVSHITAAFKSSAGNFVLAGTAIARSGCWSMLKGGITPNASTAGVSELYFLNEDANVDIMVDSISVQPFTQAEWTSHQIQSVEKVRKNRVRFQVVDPQGQPLANTNISIEQSNAAFPIGSGINADILNNQAYQNWFNKRFKLTVFANEMKWYSTESTRGREDYSVADALMQFTKTNGVSVRGHNIFWDDPKFQPSWVPSLSPADLKTATDKRVQSVVSRYKGRLIHWDVMNENLHFNFFENKLGPSASTTFFQKSRQIDPTAIPFLNDYNTIEQKSDQKSGPASYLQKIKQLRSGGYNGPLGIGLEGHFEGTPDMAYIRSSLDTLASAKLPIWITELDVSSGPNQAKFLEQIMREIHSHPGVNGIVLWTAWSPSGCYRMCLTDNNFKNLPTGNVVDKLLGEWKLLEGLTGTTDSNGYFETSLYHGNYQVRINFHPLGLNSFSSSSVNVTVAPTTNRKTLNVKLPTIT